MPTRSRVLWKGAITFGLVHIPVALHTATTSSSIDFDWLDKRSMDPVGYKRINKKTGKEITSENIVKGIEYEDGQYVVLTEEQINAAYPRSTQTIEIEAFVKNDEIPFLYLERPYYVAPINKGAKVYALLRETLIKTKQIGIARVVIQTKQHLAALIPSGPVLVLNLMRWGADIKPLSDLSLPAEGVKGSKISDKEMKMAEQLVADMSARFDPDDFRDEFKEEVMKLVHQKVKAGQTESVVQPEPQEEGHSGGAEILDLTELLQRSLKGGKRTPPAARVAAKAPAKTAAKKAAKAPATTARKPARKAA